MLFIASTCCSRLMLLIEEDLILQHDILFRNPLSGYHSPILQSRKKNSIRSIF